MLPHIFAIKMKILKYTFRLPELQVIGGELVQTGVTEETHTFTLLFKGIGIYEELSNKPLLSTLMSLGNENGEVSDNAVDSMLSKEFISNLACASYIKIENGKFHNNRATAEEFKKTGAYSEIFKDIDFVNALMKMAVECIKADETSKAKTKIKAITGKNL